MRMEPEIDLPETEAVFGTGCRLTKLELYKLRLSGRPAGTTSRRKHTRGGRS